MSDIGNVTKESSLGRRRRIPSSKKACFPCRRSKLRCDGERPCRRCAQNHLDCEFAERPKDPVVERFEILENDVMQMQQKLDALRASRTGVGATNQVDQLYGTPPHIVHPRPSAEAFYQAEPTIMASGSSAPFNVDSEPSPSVMSAVMATPGATMRSWFQDPSWPDPSLATSASSMRKPHSGKWHGFQLSVAPLNDIVARGMASEDEAQLWFDCFFRGCDRFVPAFSPDFDTYDSVRARSTLLFDTIITFGCRGAEGPMSPNCQRLQSLLRERISLQVLAPTTPTSANLEVIQALLVHACYSDNGWLLSSTAMRVALEVDLPANVERLLTKVMHRKATGTNEIDDGEKELFRTARVFLSLFNLEQILSLDGEKAPTMTLTTSPRRLRLLCGHSLTTSNDLRLFAQVELNVMRIGIIGSFPAASLAHDVEDIDMSVMSAVSGAIIDLNLWAGEWVKLVTDQSRDWSIVEVNLTILNMRIQHEWALMTLHLHALSASGIENIAVMSESQHALTHAAKAAAERHLDYMLTQNGTIAYDGNLSTQCSNERSYLAGFRYAMDFVWAKCAFSVLLVLRLGILLQDPIDRLLDRIENTRELLNELEKVGGAGVRYYRILALIVEKCERALKEMQHQQGRHSSTQAGVDLEADVITSTTEPNDGENDAGRDFTTYVPQEFLFEWHFPGLNLCYAPINWQDLFADL